MDTLKNKSFKQFEYLCRYTGVPSYFDTISGRNVSGIGSNLFTNTPAITHRVKTGDTLDYLALKYYGNPSLWWAIAYYNNIQDVFIDLDSKFEIIQIPTISTIAFGKEN